MEQMFDGPWRMNTHYMVAWGPGFSHPGGLCQLMFLWWLIDQYQASSINTGWFWSCLVGQPQYFCNRHSEMLAFLWKKNSSLLGKNLPKESWVTLNPGNIEGNLMGIWEVPFFLIDSWHWIESHLQRMLDFSKGSCGFILYFAAHLSRARHSSAFYIFLFGARAVSI